MDSPASGEVLAGLEAAVEGEVAPDEPSAGPSAEGCGASRSGAADTAAEGLVRAWPRLGYDDRSAPIASRAAAPG